MSQHNDRFDIRYKEFPRPMGMYAKDGKIWAGLGHGNYQFANYNGVTAKLEDAKTYDACYLPQNIHFTADVEIHKFDPKNNKAKNSLEILKRELSA